MRLIGKGAEKGLAQAFAPLLTPMPTSCLSKNGPFEFLDFALSDD